MPSLRLDGPLVELLGEADRAIGRLDGISALLPDRSLFLYFSVRKEALLSSQIEGTQSSLSDLLLYENDEAPDSPIEDVEEVSCYVAAVQHGLSLLRDGLPLSARLLREVHGVLLRSGRGSDKTPDEFRRTQNWVGGTRPGTALFVPPPPGEVLELMGALELFLHNRPTGLPVLACAGMAHLQFGTIHPFLDGNGRLGRMLVTLHLCAMGVLEDPLLYLSLHLKQHRDDYYALLQAVRGSGDWEAWVAFFLEAVVETCNRSCDTARRVHALLIRDRGRVEQEGRNAGSARRLLDLMTRRPILTLGRAAKMLGVSFPTASAAANRLREAGLLEETTGRARGRRFVYREYLNLLSEGTEPLR
jgi:Fic family protein